MTPPDCAGEALSLERAAARTRTRRAALCRDPALAGLLARGARDARGRAARLEAWLAAPAASDAAPATAADVAPPDAAPVAAPLAAGDASGAPEGPRPAAAAPGVVLERREVGPDLLVLRLGRPRGFDFRPGQSIRVALGGTARPYSIASAPHEPWIELCIERVPGGRLTPRLWALAPGDRVTLGRTGAGLRLDGRARVHLLVATVTGIAPFVSMLRHAVHAGGADRFVVLHGASYRDELPYADELAALAAALPDRVRYVPAVSRPAEPRNAGWTGETGRLGPLAERLAPPADGLRVYACGHPGLVDDVRARFGARGVPVSTEAYWKL